MNFTDDLILYISDLYSEEKPDRASVALVSQFKRRAKIAKDTGDNSFSFKVLYKAYSILAMEAAVAAFLDVEEEWDELHRVCLITVTIK